MTQSATKSVASEVRHLAKLHKVTAERDNISHMATCITSLSGDIVALDTVEQLLVNLKRKGIMSTSDLLAMQVRYLQEKNARKSEAKKKLKA
jgi:phosphotransferase system IIB component